jgi:hypothetical protein
MENCGSNGDFLGIRRTLSLPQRNTHRIGIRLPCRIQSITRARILVLLFAHFFNRSI